jgi:tetratricopeptide (TPR) repeat protein
VDSDTPNIPVDPAIMEQQAWLAHEHQNWPEAHARWTAYREQFPDKLNAYAADGAALRFMGRFDEAEIVYRDMFARWPEVSEFDLLADYAELAQARGDLDAGSRRWAALRVRFPDRPKCYVRDAANLSAAGHHEQAETLLRAALVRWRDEPTALIELAHVAQRRGDVHQTLRRWEAVLKVTPERIDGYLGATHALFDLQRFFDAEQVLRPALQLFPESVAIAALNARIAFARDDYGEAVKRWAAFRERFPSNPAGYAGGVEAYLAAGSHTEASDLSDKGRHLFPHELDVAVSWASVPEQVNDWHEAQRRWASTCAEFPTTLHTQSRYVRVLLRNEKWDEAESLVQAVLALHGDDFGLLRTHAECATERGVWSSAEARWLRVKEGFPESSAGWSGLGNMLRRAGRLDDSAAILSAGLQKFIGDQDLEQSLAWTLTFQRAWPDALGLWDQLTRKYPHRASVLGGCGHAVALAHQELEVAAREGKPTPFEIPVRLLTPSRRADEESAQIKKLLMQFESLGDTCEFGMVQRQFGAEPMGLLRWASIPTSRLIAALDNRFDGVGEPDNSLIDAYRGEYVTWDKRYLIHSHTFTPDTAEPLSSFTQGQLRRMRYLRRKLLEDLESGQKIFVYKSDQGLSEQDARAIHASMRRYNPRAVLLCVMLSGELHSPGAAESLDEGLFIGYIDRFSTVDINASVWLELCRRTRQLRDG